MDIGINIQDILIKLSGKMCIIIRSHRITVKYVLVNHTKREVITHPIIGTVINMEND